MTRGSQRPGRVEFFGGKLFIHYLLYRERSMYNVMVKWLTSLRESVMLDTVSPEPEVTKSLPWSRWSRERRFLAVWHMADILCVGFATRWCSAAGPRGGGPAGEARQAVDRPLWNPCSGFIEGSLHYSFCFCLCFVIFTTKHKTDKTQASENPE